MTCVLSWKVEMQLKKLSQWSIIFFIFFVYFLFLFFFLLFLLFIIIIIFRGCALWQRKRKQLCFEFHMNPNEYSISLLFHHLFHEEKNMATEYLNVRAALWLVLGKDHPSCQPLLQLEKIIAFTMVPEGVRFTQGKELGQLNNSLPS